MYKLLLLQLFMILGTVCTIAHGEEKCAVCIATIETFVSNLSDEVIKEPAKIEEAFKKFCKDAKGKETNRFCYYLGGLEHSATGILRELSLPVSWSMPAKKICERLQKKDAQICDIRVEKQIDLETVNLKSLKVRDLKNILNNWDETCDGCIEKSDFVKRIEELKPKYSVKSKTDL